MLRRQLAKPNARPMCRVVSTHEPAPRPARVQLNVTTFASPSKSKDLPKQPHVKRDLRSLTMTREQLPRPPPRDMPYPEVYTRPSRPRAYYDRPQLKRDLPIIKGKWMSLLSLGVAGLAAWGGFVFYAMNQERLHSSVVRKILSDLREHEEIKSVLGDSIRPEPAWYTNGDPWIHGSINQLQGNVDIQFRIKGSKGAGTLYFTSIRKAKGDPFMILRYKIVCDNGQALQVRTEPMDKQ